MKLLKLNQMERELLSRKEMKDLNGGASCGCGCFYQGKGGSSTESNRDANRRGGLTSPGYVENEMILDDTTPL